MANTKNAAPAAELIEGTALASPFSFDIAAAADLGAKAKGADIVTVPTGSFAGLPENVPLLIIRGDTPRAVSIRSELDQWRLHPDRRTGTAVVDTLESFVQLTNRHRIDDSVIFATMDWQKPALTTIVDYHQLAAHGDARNGRHRIHYPFPLSEEWKAWVKMNGEKMKQADFAWFLEDRAPELASPTEEERIRYERDFSTTVATPAQVVELSRGLAVHVEAKVKNAITLASGEGQVNFEESHTDGAGGKLKVPGIFILQIAPFFMGDKIRVPVRLRYRPVGGSIVWFYEIWRPDQVITEHVRHAFNDAVRDTGLPGFEGKPEMGGS